MAQWSARAPTILSLDVFFWLEIQLVLTIWQVCVSIFLLRQVDGFKQSLLDPVLNG